MFWNIRRYESYHKLRIKRSRFEQFLYVLKRNIDNDEINKLLWESGLKVNSTQYQIFRYSLLGTWLIFIHLFLLLRGGNYPSNHIVQILGIFIISSPKRYIFGKRTPFKYLLDLMILSFKKRQNAEIYRAISQLKNLALTKQKEPPSSDFILEQIRKFTKTTRPIFNRFISLWIVGRKEEACDYLEFVIGTQEAIDLANLFRKLDELKPFEMTNQITMLQEKVKRERETKKIKANENKSNLIYLIVISTSVIIMVNFIIVVYYLETINQLKFLN